MPGFETMRLPAEPTTIAPDGSDVRVLLQVGAGGMAQFELAPGRVSTAVRHRTVEEIWYIVGGRGEMWRGQGERSEVVDARARHLPDDPARDELPVPLVRAGAAGRDRRDDAALAGR